jgi:SpoIID/LytB domain protein
VRLRGKLVPVVAVGALAAGVGALGADEMSGDDKLRLLYSHRFSFTREGLPLVTVEIMHGQKSVTLSGDKGLRVLPDGDGGAEVRAGAEWTVTVEGGKPAEVRWWTIVSRHAGDAEAAEWKGRGYAPRTFETGIVFGVEGDVIDSRETYLGVAPAATEAAAGRAAAEIARKHHVDTFVHPELVKRPEGTIVARDPTGVTVRNAGALWLAPLADAITVKDVVFGGGGAKVTEKRETRTYRGRVYVAVGQDGLLTVVNALPENELLMGILPSEIFPDAPMEALKAQAVAARDELLAKIGTRHFLDPFLLCSSQHCQVYGGMAEEQARTSKAVADTRGEVLLRDGGGGLVPAYYSASCGGFGESNENVWGTPPDPSLRGRLDGDTAALPAFAGGITDANLRAFLGAPPDKFACGRPKSAKGRFRWQVKLDAADVDRLVAAEYPQVGAVKSLEPQARGVSGRVTKLRIAGDRGVATVDGELRIRRLLGGLKSSLFLVGGDRVSGFTFDGAGFGHGVGLCQTGAIGMAEAGTDYKKILGHYYPGSHVRKLY